MSTTPRPAPPFSQAFDRESEGYTDRWDGRPIVQIWRGRVLSALLTRLPPDQRILDLGAGTGADAVALTAAGHRVVALDRSPAMVARCRARGIEATVATVDDPLPPGPFDAVLSNFGMLNCLDSLRPLGRLADLVVPGGLAALVWMSRHCPTETVARLSRGRRPRRGRRTAMVSGVEVPLCWWSTAEVERALGPSFRRLHVEAIGLLDPGPDLGGRPGRRTRAEPWIATLPGLRHLGDHTLLVARRTA